MTAMSQQMTVVPQQMAGMLGRPAAMMSSMDAIKTCFNKYAGFDGRASRSEYWWFSLFLFLAGIPFSMLDGVLLVVFECPPCLERSSIWPCSAPPLRAVASSP